MLARRSTGSRSALGAGMLLLCLIAALRPAFLCGSTQPPAGRVLSQRLVSRVPAAASIAAPTVKLYQFTSCPFCSKVRAYCDYNGVRLDKVEVNPVTKAEINGVAGDYKKVPIADIDGEIATGSADIIRKIAEASGKAHSAIDEEWGAWVDNTLVKTLPPNIYRTPGEALQIASKVGESFDFLGSFVATYFGGAAMFFVAKSMAKKAGIAEGTEREALYNACGTWKTALDGQAFLGGEEPSMADLEVFGVLASVESTDTHSDMLANTGIGGWYRRMKQLCGRA